MNELPRVVVGCSAEEAGTVGPIVLAAWGEARARRWPPLSELLARRFRSARVGVEQRAITTALVHALVKYDRLLEFAGATDDGASRMSTLFALAGGATGDVLERIARIVDADERLGVAYSVPDWLVALVREDAGDAALQVALARMNDTAPRVARVNTLRTTRDACIAALAGEGVVARSTAHSSAGIVLEGRASPFRTDAFAGGDLELQDEASQLVAELVAPPPRSTVVDACAGAGGKTLALAALLAGRGRVLAIDASDAKLAELRRRARRAGASNVRGVAVDWLDPSADTGELAGRAARVLVDAPCSGLGAIRRNPEARWRLTADHLSSLVDLQGRLMRAASALVAPGGRLVYATCSFLRREGEGVFESFLAERDDFVLVTARDVLGRARSADVATRDGRYLRTWRFDGAGSDTDMDGFFAGVARRVR
jgi:16S rRNA (cytosine967-C5)-methyltransferase